MEVGHGDWRGNRESHDPTDERGATIRLRKPCKLRHGGHRCPDSDDSTDEGPREKPGLSSGTPNDGSGNRTDARQAPGAEERKQWLHDH
jgi:hypothetical protein